MTSRFKVKYIDNLDMFYPPYNEDAFPPLFHGTRRYSIECDQSLIDDMRKHCHIILEHARDYYKTLDAKTFDEYNEYARKNKLKYFAHYLVLSFGKYSNYEYKDFYMTSKFEKDYLLAFTKYGFGEIGEFAYHNVLGLKHYNIDLGINDSFDFILNHYNDFKNSELI